MSVGRLACITTFSAMCAKSEERVPINMEPPTTGRHVRNKVYWDVFLGFQRQDTPDISCDAHLNSPCKSPG